MASSAGKSPFRSPSFRPLSASSAHNFSTPTKPLWTRRTRQDSPSGQPHRSTPRTPYSSGGCRFIPNRGSQSGRRWKEHCIRKLFNGSKDDEDGGDSGDGGGGVVGEMEAVQSEMRPGREFSRRLAKVLFDEDGEGGGQQGEKILQFGENEASPRIGGGGGNSACCSRRLSLQMQLRDVYDTNRALQGRNGERLVRRASRQICSTPDRILDSPDILDDYYLNLLDWSVQNGRSNRCVGLLHRVLTSGWFCCFVVGLALLCVNTVVAIALGNAVYVWHAPTSTTTLLMRTSSPSDPVSSLRWSPDGSRLAIGTSSATVQLWDVEKRSRVRLIRGHRQRVSALAWQTSARGLLSSGSRDSTIRHHDGRAAEHAGVFRGHAQEVCGLQWCPDGVQLASGGNDNVCLVWDAAQASSSAATTPRLVLNRHVAAVKALAWCPFQPRLLASGGGTADRHIRFWNTSSGKCLGGVDTQSQVCGLVWNEHEREILSAHGFSKNQLSIWKYPSMARVADLTGHSSRVLHLAMSPDHTTVCSASADETLRFWKVFRPPDRKMLGGARTSHSRRSPAGLLRNLDIR